MFHLFRWKLKAWLSGIVCRNKELHQPVSDGTRALFFTTDTSSVEIDYDIMYVDCIIFFLSLKFYFRWHTRACRTLQPAHGRWTTTRFFVILPPSAKKSQSRSRKTVVLALRCFWFSPRSTSVAITAIRTLLDVINRSSPNTLSQLTHELKLAVQLLTTQTDSSMPSVKSGCELFLRFITLAKFDAFGIDECREKLIARGQVFLERTLSARQRISQYSQAFIVDGSVILTHSYSRVVLALLAYASKFTRFRVFVTHSEPDQSGLKMRDELKAIGIPATCILDATVAYMMEKVNFVLMGAEAVVESGGIINKIGTFNIAIAAREMNKPFYVAAESFKFVRYYPLNNRDLPDHFKYRSSTIARLDKSELEEEHPLVDYTPPVYITLLFTDIGPLTPSAVSDELIKLYI